MAVTTYFWAGRLHRPISENDGTQLSKKDIEVFPSLRLTNIFLLICKFAGSADVGSVSSVWSPRPHRQSKQQQHQQHQAALHLVMLKSTLLFPRTRWSPDGTIRWRWPTNKLGIIIIIIARSFKDECSTG